MTTEETRLFHDLIRAAGRLATMADQASVMLSEEHEGMTRPFIDEVRHIIAQCPVPPDEEWDGQLRDSDLEERIYVTPYSRGQKVGVAIKHIPTGVGRESMSKPTQDENRYVAKKALEEVVRQIHQERQRRG